MIVKGCVLPRSRAGTLTDAPDLRAHRGSTVTSKSKEGGVNPVMAAAAVPAPGSSPGWGPVKVRPKRENRKWILTNSN